MDGPSPGVTEPPAPQRPAYQISLGIGLHYIHSKVKKPICDKPSIEYRSISDKPSKEYRRICDKPLKANRPISQILKNLCGVKLPPQV